MPQWQNSTRRDRLPPDWPRIRKRRLRQDKYLCQWKLDPDDPRSDICGAYATDVDHKNPGDDHRMENLQSLCEPHHQAKSSSEGGQARAQKRREIDSRFRRTEEHPGLLS